MPSPMAASTFLGDLISQLKSLPKDNSERKQTKNAILSSITKDPDSALLHLSQISLSSPHLRSECFSLLKQLLCKDNPEIGLQVLIEVKPNLFSRLEQETDLENSKNLCKVIGNIALRAFVHWPELLDYIGSSVNSDDEWRQELGLTMFRYFPEAIIDHLEYHFDSIRYVVCRYILSDNGNLRKLALKAAINLSKLANCLMNVHEVESLVSQMLISISSFLDNEEQRKIVFNGFESLTAVVVNQDEFYKENLDTVLESFLGIAEREDVTIDVKTKAFEVLEEIDDILKDEVSITLKNLSPRDIERCFLVWMNMLTFEDDVPGWHNMDAKDDADSIEGDTLSYQLGKYFLLRISFENKDKIWPFAIKLIQEYVAADQDWQKQLAGINTLSLISEACSKELIENHLETVITVPLTLLKDSHPRVCYAALNFVQFLSVKWAPTLQMKFHRWILQDLAKLSCHPEHHRNEMQHALSILHFCKGCTKNNLASSLSDIVSIIQKLCQSKSLVARECAVSALATVAASAQEKFSLFYDTAMHTLKGILIKRNEAPTNRLYAKCLNSISTIAMVVGKEKFANDAFQVMDLLISFLKSLKKSDHSIKIIIFKALQNIFNCLEQNFSEYLGDLMTLLLPSCKLFTGQADIKGPIALRFENNSLDLMEHTLACEEIAMACKLLYVFASQLKEKYFPWIMMASKTLVPMLKECDVVRMNAAPVLPSLLKSATYAVSLGVSEGNDMSFVKNLVNLFIPALLQAFRKEERIKLHELLFKTLRECLEVPESLVTIDHPHIMLLAAQIQKGFNYYITIKMVRELQEPKKPETQQQELLFDAGYCLVTLIIRLKADFLKSLDSELLKAPLKFLSFKDCTFTEKGVAFYIVRNVMQEFQEAALPYYDMYLPHLLNSCTDDNPKVRQEAALGIVACAKFGTSKLKDIARGALGILPSVIRHLEALSLKSENAYDVAVLVLKEVCEPLGKRLDVYEKYKNSTLHIRNFSLWYILPGEMSILPLSKIRIYFRNKKN
ncbi:hypothetical protein UlMin_023781 [Ulmus minor]